MSHAYRLSALKLESDFDLPELLPWDGPVDASADVVVKLGKVPSRLDSPDHIAPIFQTKGRGEYLLTLPGTGRILVQDGARVTVEPEPGADPTDTRAILTGPIQAMLWHQRGLLPLHASVVSVEGRSIALAARSAAGKSTLAAILAATGHQVMSDNIGVVDISPGNEARVLPGSPYLRLWRDALNRLGIAVDGLKRTSSAKERYLVDCLDGSPRKPQKLAAIVLVSRGLTRAVTIARLHGFQATAALHDVVHMRRPARALARDPDIFSILTRLVSSGVTVWRLKVPDDPACLREAAATVPTVLEA
jgi:hypothetical protein